MALYYWPDNTYTMAASVILAEYARYKVVPFSEIESNSSDPKHVG